MKKKILLASSLALAISSIAFAQDGITIINVEGSMFHSDSTYTFKNETNQVMEWYFTDSNSNSEHGYIEVKVNGMEQSADTTSKKEIPANGSLQVTVHTSGASSWQTNYKICTSDPSFTSQDPDCKKACSFQARGFPVIRFYRYEAAADSNKFKCTSDQRLLNIGSGKFDSNIFHIENVS